MTWLPVPIGGDAERDVVLGLKKEPYTAMRQVLESAWRITDPRVLDLCRLRLAQLSGARAELDRIDDGALAELEHWESSPGFTELERAALAFAEQYHYDHQLLDGGPRSELERHLSRREVVNFVWALHMNDAYIRALSLLDIAPDPESAPPRAERTAPAASGAGSDPRAADEPADTGIQMLMDPEFAAAYRQFNPVVVRQSLVDEVTSEAIRLRNASHQGCHY
jgi:alkylhydroperoxidase family enzyme